jgi:hypothetical protein
MTTTKSHIPSYSARGLRGPAMCGRYADYGTGDHDLCRRLARQSIRERETAHLCARCVSGLTRAIGMGHEQGR